MLNPELDVVQNSVSIHVLHEGSSKETHTVTAYLIYLFIKELPLEIIDDGRHGVTLNSDFIKLFIMLFADCIVLLTETVIGLQSTAE